MQSLPEVEFLESTTSLLFYTHLKYSWTPIRMNIRSGSFKFLSTFVLIIVIEKSLLVLKKNHQPLYMTLEFTLEQ